MNGSDVINYLVAIVTVISVIFGHYALIRSELSYIRAKVEYLEKTVNWLRDRINGKNY